MAVNFSFIIPGVLAGMERPGTYDSVDSDLCMLETLGICAVVSLTESPLDINELSLHGLCGLHLPVCDFSPPTLEQIDTFVRFVNEHQPAVVHCAAGMGRTGTMLACYLVSCGRTPELAIREVRKKRPGSVETHAQEKTIYDFALSRTDPGRRRRGHR